MEILKSVHNAATKANKRFLLIGGHALNVHGISSSTVDVDLMVEASKASFWRDLLTRLGYEVFHESAGFMQSKPALITAWPIDLMLVSEATMTKALRDAETTDVFGPPIRVAAVGSLIAMKLHALKFVDAVRALKDESDLLALLELAGIPLDSEPFRQLCLRYATIEWYERIRQFKK